MYINFRDLVLATRRKYKGVKHLSKTDDTSCYYSHEHNGVGCAIGCHFPPEIAKTFDPESYEPGDVGTGNVKSVRARFSGQFDKVIDRSIPSELLELLQKAHDRSQTATEFRHRLDNWLKTGSFNAPSI